ncbi:MAG TPA: hypothetical protein VMV56_07605 [Williamwhitmania sp.]|nr:hypothetical protein [Williamwhitmania sp.]
MKIKYLIIGLILLSVNLLAISKNDFIVNVSNENGFVKEIDNQVVVPFKSEYELLLKNNHDRKCTAKVWIDGALVSNFGDFIIDANSELNLERFVTESMQDGKKFQFVTLDNPEVDDPSRKENGLIKVEFRLEKVAQKIQAQPMPEYHFPIHDFEWNDNNNMMLNGEIVTLDCYSTCPLITDCSSNVNCSNTSAQSGATIGGSQSDQLFTYSNIDVENDVTIIELKIKGI